MQIELKGAITIERIENALESAADHLGEHFGGFFNASLHLTAYAKDGVEMDLTRNGRKVVLLFNAPEKGSARPEPTAIVDRRSKPDGGNPVERRNR